jgi:hypothetical protein
MKINQHLPQRCNARFVRRPGWRVRLGRLRRWVPLRPVCIVWVRSFRAFLWNTLNLTPSFYRTPKYLAYGTSVVTARNKRLGLNFIDYTSHMMYSLSRLEI